MAPGPNELYGMGAPEITYQEFSFDDKNDMDDENQLKVEINAFVWSHAPASMPLGKADELACKIFELMLSARNEFGGG